MTEAPASRRSLPGTEPPRFDAAFREGLADLLTWRRDVRRFRADRPVDEAVLARCLALAIRGPSVGNSQPWRFVRVADPARRAAVAAEFERCNEGAAAGHPGARGAAYRALKLAGLREAPVHLAAYCDGATAHGHGLGRATMPDALRDSVVAAIHALWLVLRANDLGLGWVTILEPGRVAAILDVPAHWSLVGYLCVGHPEEVHDDPELVRHDWQARLPSEVVLLTR